ncbi:Sporulation initiation phosphotransferase F [Calidithermus terrae]|uniref:Sporulation initiation phosphotransferase F n=1 Tax=Calidithermus terrae TaxID=1408545 RepID=A0A399EGY8_9DEIN|nr:response regulator [Calidithermus terrae]RIH81561.1 Sporulation initiation phosphotransferase F [Calidithermus terrae]
MTNSLVLIVDDDPAIRAFLRRVLRLSGLEVLEAADGGSGLELALAEPAGAVILDYNLPDTDGLSVLQRLKARKPALPVLFLTAYGEPELERRALELGADLFHSKPMTLDALLRAVRQLLERPPAGGPGP